MRRLLSLWAAGALLVGCGTTDVDAPQVCAPGKMDAAEPAAPADRPAEAFEPTFWEDMAMAGVEGTVMGLAPLIVLTAPFWGPIALVAAQDSERSPFERALVNAECGDPRSQARVGCLYQSGEGTAPDDVRAYMWYSLAAANGVDGAAAQRDRLSERMSAARIAEAEPRVAAWRPANCAVRAESAE